MTDHIRLLIEIPPKHSVAQLAGYIKGKSASYTARTYEGRQKNFTGQHFQAKGYFISTDGMDETVIREYIKNQENEDSR
jgi:putative transposase